jgi:RNA polymerase sigma factor (sigma-70 family)
VTLLLRELLKKCETGDGAAVAELVRRFRPWALDLATALSGDREAAEDAVQEAFISALHRLRNLREPEAFPGWFRQIIRTQVNRTQRGRQELPVPEAELSAEVTASPEEHLQAEELRSAVRKALQALPSTGRATAERYYLDELSITAIAERLGVPEGTIKRRLFDARAKLRELLLGYINDVEPEPKERKDPGFPL